MSSIWVDTFEFVGFASFGLLFGLAWFLELRCLGVSKSAGASGDNPSDDCSDALALRCFTGGLANIVGKRQ